MKHGLQAFAHIDRFSLPFVRRENVRSCKTNSLIRPSPAPISRSRWRALVHAAFTSGLGEASTIGATVSRLCLGRGEMTGGEGEGIVDLVSHTGDGFTECGHLGRLYELGLRHLQLCGRSFRSVPALVEVEEYAHFCCAG